MCPAVPDDQVGHCTENCSGDESCPGEQMCCSNGCGHVCVAPVPGMNILSCCYDCNKYNFLHVLNV